MKNLIGITMRVINNESYYEVRDCISHDYIDFFNKYDIQPILISNNLSDPVEYFKSLNCKALILTGGEDILITYKEIIDNKIDFKNKRDEVEYALLNYCVHNDIPVLGICRGMQLINLYFKGKISNLSLKLDIANHVNINHSIEIIDNKFIKNDTSRFVVNSYHNNGVIVNDLSDELKCFAISEDKIVEGLYKEDKIIGMQWHPERSSSLCDDYVIKKWLALVEEE